MPASAMARATLSPAASPPRTEISDAVDAALHGVAQRVEGAAADILAHRAGVGGARHERAGTWPRRSIWAPPTARILGGE